MGEQSAGILVYRHAPSGLEVFLVHPGGPYWKNKDAGAWSMPKGIVEPGEDMAAAAGRELAEETGVLLEGGLLFLGTAKQPSGKTIHAFASEGAIDPENVRSNTFELEWPPRSGSRREFPEVDEAAWFPIAVAYDKILRGQKPFLDRLASLLS